MELGKETRPLERKPTISMKELMMNVALGAKDEDTLVLHIKQALSSHFQSLNLERLRRAQYLYALKEAVQERKQQS